MATTKGGALVAYVKLLIQAGKNKFTPSTLAKQALEDFYDENPSNDIWKRKELLRIVAGPEYFNRQFFRSAVVYHRNSFPKDFLLEQPLSDDIIERHAEYKKLICMCFQEGNFSGNDNPVTVSQIRQEAIKILIGNSDHFTYIKDKKSISDSVLRIYLSELENDGILKKTIAVTGRKTAAVYSYISDKVSQPIEILAAEESIPLSEEPMIDLPQAVVQSAQEKTMAAMQETEPVEPAVCLSTGPTAATLIPPDVVVPKVNLGGSRSPEQQPLYVPSLTSELAKAAAANPPPER
jgi:hypothetical protein